MISGLSDFIPQITVSKTSFMCSDVIHVPFIRLDYEFRNMSWVELYP